LFAEQRQFGRGQGAGGVGPAPMTFAKVPWISWLSSMMKDAPIDRP